MKWRHIMDSQPEHGQMIIQIDVPYEGHYNMGMRKYYQTINFTEYLLCCKTLDMPTPNFWWIPASEFPFPEEIKQ